MQEMPNLCEKTKETHSKNHSFRVGQWKDTNNSDGTRVFFVSQCAGTAYRQIKKQRYEMFEISVQMTKSKVI